LSSKKCPHIESGSEKAFQNEELNILHFGKGGVNNMTGYDGPTALHLAASEGKKMIVDFLLCKRRKTAGRIPL